MDVWPPPPNVEGHPAFMGHQFEFLNIHKRDSENVSDFRTGTITVDPAGITFQGKTAIPAEIYKPVMIVGWLVIGCAVLIADLIMRYCVFYNRVCRLNWSSIQRIVLVEQRCLACVVYDAPNEYGKVKTFSFAFSMPPERYDAFLATINQYAPGLARPGKLKRGDSTLMMILMGFIIFMCLLIIIVAIAGALSGNPS
jgi:hypothetical protein